MKKRIIKPALIIQKTADLIRLSNSVLPEDVLSSISEYLKNSNSEQEKHLLNIIIENAGTAKKENIPLCQDTDMSMFFVEMGIGVEIEGGDKSIEELINDAVKLVYAEKHLRPSIIDDPINGKNTLDNTPAFIHLESNNSDKIKISFLAKGGGSENASCTSVLSPSEGFPAIKELLIRLVCEKGINACPPLIIGIGIGGSLDHAVLASKKALLRKIGNRNPKSYYAQKELELKNELNLIGIGAMGLGGSTTVLDVFINELPRHIASLPVAISILCHSARRGELII